MRKSELEKYEDIDELKQHLSKLDGRKYKLDCGHHVTLGYYLGNDLVIYNGRDRNKKITCVDCRD